MTMTGGERGGGGLHALPGMTTESREENIFKAGMQCCDWLLEFMANSGWFN